MADHNAADRRRLAAQGKAMPNPDGPPKFPITDRSDLESAIRLHGHVPKSKQPAVRRHIVKHAKRLKLDHLIPPDWHLNTSP